MKNFKIILISILCLMLLVPSLSSCLFGKEDTETTEDTTIMQEEIKTYIIENGKTSYKIIYPQNPNSIVFASAQRLRDELKKITGIEFTMQDDFIAQNKEHDDDTKEILIGVTNYKQTAEAISNLNGKDFIITEIGNKIIIAGTNDTTTSKAVNYYLNNLVKNNIEKDAEDRVTLLFESYAFYDKYSIEDFIVGGVNLRNFTIVYDENTDGAKEAAESLEEKISEKCGYRLDVVSDKTAVSDNEILIGNTNRPLQKEFNQANPCGVMEYKIAEYKGQLIISSGGLYSMNAGVKRISAKYLLSGLKKIDIPKDEIIATSLLDDPTNSRAEGTDLRVMTFNIMAEMSGWAPEWALPINQRIEIVKAVFDVYSPDVAGIQEISFNLGNAIQEALGDEYEFIYKKTPDGLDNYSTILYKRDKYTVIDKGLTYFTPNGKNVIRLVTWALLEDNVTKERFGMFNSHWTPHDDAEKAIHAKEHAAMIRNFVAKYNVPVFSTADYNNRQDTALHAKFMTDSNLLDATEVARQNGTLINDFGGCGTVGVPHTTSMNRIDHIFISKNVTVLGFETVVKNETFMVSDHSAKYVDIKFNK